MHKLLFWVSIAVLQLEEAALYAAGMAMLEQNLHCLDEQGLFEDTVSSLSSTSLILNHRKLIH